jgi:hypothetical protein
MNCLQKHVIEEMTGQIEGKIIRRKRNKPLDGLKVNKMYWSLRQEALVRTFAELTLHSTRELVANEFFLPKAVSVSPVTYFNDGVKMSTERVIHQHVFVQMLPEAA